MAEASLQDRLRDHAKAFDGLLSLIPAKMYYGEDTSDQWRKKKQTKAEAKAAKRGKLDPDSELNRNAKEVMDERARNKRKLGDMQDEDTAEDEDEDEDEESAIGPVDKEKPGEGLKKKTKGDDAGTKKQKGAGAAEDGEQSSKKEKARAEKKVSKKQRKEEEKRMQLVADEADDGKATAEIGEPLSGAEEQSTRDQPGRDGHAAQEGKRVETAAEDEAEETEGEDDLEKMDISGLAEPETDNAPTSTSTSGPSSPVFDALEPGKGSAEPASTTTSISSAVAPSEKPRHIKLPSDTTALRARLAARIEALRAARKADVDGKPIRTRQELIESRREKQAQRKAHKKELRRLAKVEEDRKREEALASARNSPALLSPMVGLDDEGNANHFAFGRVAFTDGTHMSHDLSYEKSDGKKRKGPSDPKTALAKLESQKRRIAGLDENKRKEVLEKEAWLAARRRAEGEKVRDDEALLRKAVKRKDKSKKKSEREWRDRSKGVEDAIKSRQRKREENLRKRRDEKGAGKGGKKKAGAKKKGRPGFEGSFGGAGGKRK